MVLRCARFARTRAPLIKSEQYRHRRSTNEQSTVGRLQLARSWVVRTMSSSEKYVSGSIRSLGSSPVVGLIQRVDVSGFVLLHAQNVAKNLSCREMIVDSRGLLLVRSYNSI